MPQLVVAAVAAFASIGAAAALEGAVIGGITIAGWAATAIGAAIGLVISTAGALLLSRMQRKPSVPDTAQDRKQAVRSGIEPHRIIYGRALVSGPVLYIGSSGTDNEFFHVVVALAGHEVEEIEEVWINDYQIPLVPRGTDADGLNQAGGALEGTVIIHAYPGNDGFADPRLVAECPSDWTEDHVLNGIAYVYCRIEYNQDRFPSGFNSIAAVVKGKKVYDPRSVTTAWSDNAALCIRDYLTAEYGLSCDELEIDDSYFIAAANICDEVVYLDSEETLPQLRYTLNGSFKLDQTPLDIMEGMLSACGGSLVYVQGTYRLHVAAYDAPAEVLTASSFAGPLKVQTKVPRRELFNAVDGTYINPDQKWSAVSFPRVSVGDFIAEDGATIPRDAEFPFTTDRAAVQRLARIQLLIARRPITLEASFKYAQIRFACWDTVALTLDDFGWDEKVFRIRSWKFDPVSGIVTMRMQEEYSTNYSWTYLDAGPDLTTPDSTLVSPLDIPTPTDLTVTPTTAINVDGATVPALQVVWAVAAHPFVTATEVQWKADGDPAWSSREIAKPTYQLIISPVLSGVTYNVRARAVALLVRSDWTGTVDEDGGADTTAPSAPGSIAATATSVGIRLTWTKPPETDFAGVEIYENTTSGESGWVLIASGYHATGYVRSGLGGGLTRYYITRSYDRTGNFSAFTGAVSATSAEVGTTDVSANAFSKLNSTKANDSITVYGNVTYTAISLTVVVPDTATRVKIEGMIDLSQSGTLPSGSGGSGDSGGGSAEGGEGE